MALTIVVGTIFRFEIERGWDQAIRPYMAQHAAPWVASVIERLGGFTGGVLLTLAILFLLEWIFAYRRRRASSQTSPGNSSAIPRGAAYVPVRHLDGADYDLIARDPPLRIRAIKTSDYTDVTVTLYYTNRSQHSLWLEPNGVHLSVDGKMPPKPGGTVTRPFTPGRMVPSQMGTVRLYTDVAGKTGVLSFTILFGLTKETARTTVNFKYFFLLKAAPQNMNAEETIEYEITQDQTSYDIRESEAQRRP